MVATRLAHPGREFAVLRALAFAWFNSPLLLDEDAAIAAALAEVDGIDAAMLVAALDSAAVSEAYEADKAQARSAAGGPTEFQGKAAVSDGLVRYTAPSVVFEDGERRLEAGGFQPLEAYDVLLANLDTTLRRVAPPEEPLELLALLQRGPVHAGGRGAAGRQPDRRRSRRGRGRAAGAARGRARDAHAARR